MKRFTPSVGDTLKVSVVKATRGRDGYLYLTVSHPDALNKVSFKWGGAIKGKIDPIDVISDATSTSLLNSLNIEEFLKHDHEN